MSGGCGRAPCAWLLRLREDPRPGRSDSPGRRGCCAFGWGDWRILYEVREREVVVLVARFGPRGEMYERLG